MRYRLALVRCYDCGRETGGCYVVQRKGWFGWSDFLSTYDRDGSQMPEHYRSQTAAISALKQAVDPVPPEFVVVKEITL